MPVNDKSLRHEPAKAILASPFAHRLKPNFRGTDRPLMKSSLAATKVPDHRADLYSRMDTVHASAILALSTVFNGKLDAPPETRESNAKDLYKSNATAS